MSIRLSKDIGTIRSELYARIEAVQDDYAARGWLPARLNLNKGIARGIIEIFAWGLWQLYNFLAVIHKQAIPRESTGEWLDTHAAQVDESRKSATKARGNVLFHRGDQAGNIRIPAGRVVRTLPDGKGDVYRYVTDELAVLPEGAASVAVPATAEEYGQGANAAVGQIGELVTPVEGVRGVSNAADWLTAEGADEESDASLQRRYVLAWQSQAGVTRAAYEAAALSVPGVVDVYVADRHPRGEGTVDVVIQGSAGLPTARLLEAVRAALDAAIVINHDLLVKAPEPVNVSVKAVLELLFRRRGGHPGGGGKLGARHVFLRRRSRHSTLFHRQRRGAGPSGLRPCVHRRGEAHPLGKSGGGCGNLGGRLGRSGRTVSFHGLGGTGIGVRHGKSVLAILP